MVYQINNIETITTKTEAEAFLLESNLIKKIKPKFNIVLRDDKSLPYILISTKNKWPQILKHRGKQKNIGIYWSYYEFILSRTCLFSFKKIKPKVVLVGLKNKYGQRRFFPNIRREKTKLKWSPRIT